VAAESPSLSDSHLPPADPSLDHFARFGLERGCRVSRDALETTYLELSRRFHPDRFAAADPRTRRMAMEHASLVNEGYRTLRDPVRRAEYLVRLGGIDLDSSDPETGAPRPDQSFLIEMLERREHLEDLRGNADALAELRDEVEAEAEAELDRAVSALDGSDVRGAAFALMSRRYLARFLDEIEAAEADA
jgi:molecular chaperone HscB